MVVFCPKFQKVPVVLFWPKIGCRVSGSVLGYFFDCQSVKRVDACYLSQFSKSHHMLGGGGGAKYINVY